MLEGAIRFLNANLDRDPDNVDAHSCLALAYCLNQDEHMARGHIAVAGRLRETLQTPSGWTLAVNVGTSLEALNALLPNR
jgi:hypothetical protein